jgi:glycosyltransferase involved in cell wall biosynthesis
MKKIKVLILAKDIDGGTGTYIKDLLNLKKLFQISLVIINPPSYRRLNIKNKYIFPYKNPERYFFSFYNIVFFVKELFFIKNVLSKIDPDIILSIDAHSNIIAQLLKYRNKFKTILTTHIYLKNTIERKSTHIFNYFLKKSITFFYNQADLLVGVSKGVSSSLKHDFNIKKPIITIYHGVKSNKFPKIKRNNSNQIITVCRFDKQKDLPTLINAFKIVNTTVPNSKLMIIGDGPEKKNTLQLILKLELTNSVRLISWKNNIDDYLKKADIFVLSSYYEGFSYSILEAMNCGLPIVSTNSPFGPKEILQNNKYGILVPVARPQVLADGIIKVLKSKTLYKYYSKQSLLRSKFFSIEEMIEKYRYYLSMV